MSRPGDWSPVGLDVDPTPGDPVLVLSGGREYLDVADSIEGAAAAMGRLDVAGAVSAAVDALIDRKEDTIGEIRKAHARYQAAGDALVSYAGTLEQVQSDTLAALQKARGAHADAADAARTEHYYQDLAETETDAAQKTAYQHKAKTAADGSASAQHLIAAAQDDITSAVATRDRAADAAADQINQITSHDDLNDSWWDNWGSKLVAAIADIADLVSTIAGILAVVVAFIPVVGTALAGVLIVVAAVAAIVSALANIALAATGERSWGEAGIAIAGAALSVIGLGAAAKAATGISRAAFKAGARETMVGLRGGLKGGLKGFGKEPFCKVGFGTCFTAGTLVRTPGGDRPIETLRAGDKVYAVDQVTGAELVESVEETFVRTTTTLFHLTVNGHTVTTTAEHPFMVTGMGWVQAADLRAGDLLTTPGGTVVLDATRTQTVAEQDPVTVYNIHVRTHHTYYVLAGAVPVLVHNMAGHQGGRLTGVDERARFVSDQRRAHILDGDYTGGGHRWPGAPGKTPFPQEWSDDEIMAHISDIVADPRSTWSEGGPGGALLTKTGRPARFVVRGERQGIQIKVVTAPAGEGVVTAYPVGGVFVGS